VAVFDLRNPGSDNAYGSRSDFILCASRGLGSGVYCAYGWRGLSGVLGDSVCADGACAHGQQTDTGRRERAA
jgi:hypothetical protein